MIATQCLPLNSRNIAQKRQAFSSTFAVVCSRPAMSERRPIGEYFALPKPRSDVLVRDDRGDQVEAAWGDEDGWMDISDPERPTELSFEPRWFKVIGEPR